MTEQNQDDIHKIPTSEEVNNFIIKKVLEIKELLEQTSGMAVRQLTITASGEGGVRVVVDPWMTPEIPNLDKHKIN